MEFAFSGFVSICVFFFSQLASCQYYLCFYGPVFAVIQELVPSNIRGTIVGFNLVCLNLLGYVPGSMIAGIALDSLIASEVETPYTITLVGFNIIFLILGPVLYYLAGKFYESDKAKLARDFG